MITHSKHTKAEILLDEDIPPTAGLKSVVIGPFLHGEVPSLQIRRTSWFDAFQAVDECSGTDRTRSCWSGSLRSSDGRDELAAILAEADFAAFVVHAESDSGTLLRLRIHDHHLARIQARFVAQNPARLLRCLFDMTRAQVGARELGPREIGARERNRRPLDVFRANLTKLRALQLGV